MRGRQQQIGDAAGPAACPGRLHAYPPAAQQLDDALPPRVPSLRARATVTPKAIGGGTAVVISEQTSHRTLPPGEGSPSVMDTVPA